MRRSFLSVLALLGGISIGLPTAQGQQDGGAEKGAKKGQKEGAAGRDQAGKGEREGKGEKGAKASPLNLELLTTELKLDGKQVEQIKKLLADYAKKHKEEKGKAESEETKKQLEKLKEELKAAKKAGDDTKLKAAKDKMKDLKKESGAKGGSMDEELIAAISGDLNGEQKEQFKQIIARYSKGGGGSPSDKYREAVKNLKLSDSQKKSVDKLLSDFDAKMQNADKGDKDASKALVSKLRDDITALLDGEQKKAFQSAIKDSGHKDGERGGKSGGQKSGKGHDGGASDGARKG